nr:hypothetical protein CFP56_29921 [Quercus suber]
MQTSARDQSFTYTQAVKSALDNTWMESDKKLLQPELELGLGMIVASHMAENDGPASIMASLLLRSSEPTRPLAGLLGKLDLSAQANKAERTSRVLVVFELAVIALDFSLVCSFWSSLYCVTMCRIRRSRLRGAQLEEDMGDQASNSRRVRARRRCGTAIYDILLLSEQQPARLIPFRMCREHSFRLRSRPQFPYSPFSTGIIDLPGRKLIVLERKFLTFSYGSSSDMCRVTRRVPCCSGAVIWL